MKNRNVILASIIIMALVAAGVGAGTMAYFSSAETAGITFTAGTPDLQLSFDGTNWYNGLTTSFPVWSPGDSYEVRIWTRNVGNVGLENLFVAGGDLSGSLALAQKILITDVAYTENPALGGGSYDSNGYYWVHPGSPGHVYYLETFGDGLAPLTLAELANYNDPSPNRMNFGWGNSPHTRDYLLPDSGGNQGLYIKFTFDPLAGNELQGTSCGFNLVLRGTDEPGSFVWPAIWP